MRQGIVEGYALQGTGMILYQMVLRAPDCIIELTLPRDLTMAEVKRLTAFLETLVNPPSLGGKE